MTTAPGPFQVAKQISDNLGASIERQGDISALDKILANVSGEGTDEELNNAMAQIVQRVSPARQKAAVGVLQDKRNQITKGKRGDFFEKQGLPRELADQPESVQTAILKSEASLTPFQKLSTTQREQERQRKTRSGVLSIVKSLGDSDTQISKNVPFLSAKINDLIDTGIEPIQALNQVMEKNTEEKGVVNELSIPKYSAKKGNDAVVKIFKENNITTPNLMLGKLQNMNYPFAEAQKIVKQVLQKNGAATTQAPQTSAKPQEELPVLSPAKVRDTVESMPGPSQEQKLKQAKDFFETQGYKVNL